MVTTNEFVTKFHNLEGVTVAEKRRSFNKLLNESDSLLKDPKLSKDIATNLDPGSYLEALFRVEVLLIAQHVPELLEILKSGNEALISKIIKHQWFIQEAFRDVAAQKIVSDLLPDMSYTIRTKFLKQLVLWLGDEEKLYELFDCCKNKYGLSAALPLLLGCTATKIESVLKNNTVFLTSGQVKSLIQKAPKLLPLYVEEHIKHKGNCLYVLSDKSIQKLLFTKYNEIYKILDDKYSIYLNYGRRISKKVFEEKKEEILADPKKYDVELNMSVFVRKLGKNGQFKNYFKSLFPKSVKEFSYKSFWIYQVLGHYPKNKRYQLLKETYEEIYKTKLIDSLNHFDTDVLELMCDNDAVERDCVATRFLECTNKTSYAVYQKPAKSIPYIKNEINLSTSISKRRTLIKLLIDTWKVNDDLDSLIEVIKYVITRHRNDDEVILDFLHHLGYKFDMHTFTTELWQPIMELVNIYSVKNRKHTNFGSILLQFAEFKYNAGEPIKDIVATYMTRDKDGQFFNNHECKNFKFLQLFIDEYMTLYPQNNPQTDNYTYCSLFSKLNDWNIKHSEYANSYFKYPKFVESVKEAMVTEGCSYYDIWFLVSSKERNNFVEEVTNLFWEKHASQAEIKDITYFFRWYPSILLNYKDSFIESQINGSNCLVNVLKWVEKYEHLQFPKHVINFNQKKFAEEDKFESDLAFDRLFAMLAYFMKPKEFMTFISDYKPKTLSIDMLEDDEKQIYKVQTDVAKSLKYAKFPTDFLPLVMSYCGGDFLKHVLDSLYKYFHRVSNKILTPYFEQLSKNAVSVRKHALFLTYRVGDIDSIKRNLTSALATEKNMSLQKRFMITAFQCFLKNQSPEFFELFKTSLPFLNANDKESFETLVGPHEYIPQEYYSRFYQEVWNLLAKKNITESLKYSLRCRLATQVEVSLDLMSSEFCHDVIDTLFFKFSDSFEYNSGINRFVFQYLLNSKDPGRFTRIFKVLESSKIYLAKGSEFQPSCKSSLESFLSHFCNFYFNEGETDKWDKALLLDFVDRMLNLLPVIEVFREYVKLSFTKLLIKSTDLKRYTPNVVRHCEELIQKYSFFIINDIEDAVSDSLKFFYKNDDPKNTIVEFVEELIRLRSTETFYVLGLMILIESNTDKNKMKECLKIFKASNFPYVQIYLKRQNLKDINYWG